MAIDPKNIYTKEQAQDVADGLTRTDGEDLEESYSDWTYSVVPLPQTMMYVVKCYDEQGEFIGYM